MRLPRLKKSATAMLLAGSIALAGAACGGDDDADPIEDVDVGDDADVDVETEGGTETTTETTTG